MRFIYILLVLLGFLGHSSALAIEESRAGCDSCRIQVKNLDQPLKLSGNWLFTRDDNVHNANVELDTSSWPVIKAPGPWKGAYPDQKNYTVGWYRGVFEFDQSMVGQDVVILLNAYMGRVNVYNNGQEIYRRPGDINVERYYATQPIPIRFQVTQVKHVLAIRIDTLLMTGVYQLPFEIRKYDKHDSSLAWHQFQNGELRILAAFIVFCFGLFFMLVYRKTRYSLYLVASLASISVFPFFVAPSDFLMKVLPPEPMLLLHYTGLITFFGAYLFSQFFYKFTPKTNWVLGTVYSLLALTIAAQMVHLNLDLFQKVRAVFFMTALLLGTLALYQSVRGALSKRPGAITLCIGMGIFYVAGVHDMLLALGRINSMSTLFYGVLGFVISMLYVASNIFATTFVENKRMAHDLKLMNEKLEDLVAERTLQLRQKTNDILTMLQNMPQGILTVTQGATIHPEYSAYLEQIFETKDIAGKGMMDVVFSKTNLGSDVLSQVEAVADACIGEDKMNFEFNTHLMVTELDKTMPSGRVKSLELSWSPICNDADICEKLMLCVRDVTELKGLAAEASKQRRELEMIGQILSVNQEKFHQFIDSSGQFIEENRALIESTESRDLEAITTLFRNMHTIKGNARTYGLLQLTNTVHETEQVYDDLRKNPDADWNKARLLEQLKDTYSAIQEYARVNEVKLGRRGPGRRGGVDKFLMVQKDHIESLIGSLEAAKEHDPVVRDDLLHRVLSTLKQIGTEKIEDVLAGVIDSLPSLARELGKEAPTIQIDDNNIVVRNQIADLLKNVFMHLLRNSIDHGIETAEQRVAQGKSPAGTINLGLSTSDGKLWLKLRDDGRGLAMGFIRRKAIDSGLIQENQSVSPEQLAQLIFAPGFSTASVVTEVSGRGVGMDAVKGFVEREAGTIELRLLDEDPNSEFRQFETVISLPDNFALRLDA
ncbi:Hpt domain-containing protein [Rhodoferax sp.]|uniref:Hpt domain-containing protein n=1 Tax=Rhodoferax sp. TaxID=50421 RepID=UPI00275D81AE|nr:Hpt domain-containing protein [Rhodoferax sp.]